MNTNKNIKTLELFDVFSALFESFLLTFSTFVACKYNITNFVYKFTHINTIMMLLMLVVMVQMMPMEVGESPVLFLQHSLLSTSR